MHYVDLLQVKKTTLLFLIMTDVDGFTVYKA